MQSLFRELLHHPETANQPQRLVFSTRRRLLWTLVPVQPLGSNQPQPPPPASLLSARQTHPQGPVTFKLCGVGSPPWPWSWKLPGMLALRSPRGAPSTTVARNHRISRSPLHLQVWFLCAAWTLLAAPSPPSSLGREQSNFQLSVNGSSFTSGHSPSKQVKPALS